MCNACYVHVPFCKDICAYCDFTRCRYHNGLAKQWLRAIQKEIQDTLSSPLTSLYVGGGTPSCLSYSQLQTLLQCFSVYCANDCEFTMEANVESLTEDKIKLCKEMGVNRISLGVQTLQPTLLTKIQRHHTSEMVIETINLLHQYGISNISIDLIYGLPTQTFAMWKEDLQKIVKEFEIEHISLYALTIEEHSQFGRDNVKNIDAQIETDMYEYAISYLQAHGFYQYEISNFAKLDKQSVHNKVYWHYEDFYGIGCGASGKLNHQRYDNTKNLHTYLKEGSKPDITPLDIEEEMFEFIMMGLRLKEGIYLVEFEKRFHIGLLIRYKAAIDEMIHKELLMLEQGYLKTTQRGMYLLNDVLIAFMDC